MNRFKAALTLLGLFGTASILFISGSRADEAPTDLASFMDQNLSRISSQACSADEEGSGSQDWEVRHFFLNISPYVMVGIRGFADVTFTPEVEFVWERAQN